MSNQNPSKMPNNLPGRSDQTSPNANSLMPGTPTAPRQRDDQKDGTLGPQRIAKSLIALGTKHRDQHMVTIGEKVLMEAQGAKNKVRVR